MMKCDWGGTKIPSSGFLMWKLIIVLCLKILKKSNNDINVILININVKYVLSTTAVSHTLQLMIILMARIYKGKCDWGGT